MTVVPFRLQRARRDGGRCGVRALTLAAVLLTGCGGAATCRVSGRIVRPSGEPLEGANVIARNEDTGSSYYGTTNDDGRYELSTIDSGAGVPPGTYSVVIMEKTAS